jgi:hypothetical protein
MASKLPAAFAALVVLAVVRVPLLPGWQVPLAALVLVLILGIALVFGTVLVLRVRAERHTPRHARTTRPAGWVPAGGAS